MKYGLFICMLMVSWHVTHGAAHVVRLSRPFSCSAVRCNVHPLDAIATENVPLIYPWKLSEMLLSSYPTMPEFPGFLIRAGNALNRSLDDATALDKKRKTEHFLKLMSRMYSLRDRHGVAAYMQQDEIGEMTKAQQILYETMRQTIFSKRLIPDNEMKAFLQRHSLIVYTYDAVEQSDIGHRGIRTYLQDNLMHVCREYYAYCSGTLTTKQNSFVIIEDKEQQPVSSITLPLPIDLHAYDPMAVSYTLAHMLERALAHSKGSRNDEDLHARTAHTCGIHATKARIEMLRQMLCKLAMMPSACGYNDEIEVATAQLNVSSERKMLKEIVAKMEAKTDQASSGLWVD